MIDGVKNCENKRKLTGGQKKDWSATEVGEILRRKGVRVRGGRKNINVTIEGTLRSVCQVSRGGIG